jgi:hypothetical protein
VGIRLRPLSKAERGEGEKEAWRAEGPATLRYTGTVDPKVKHLPLTFAYDRVFAPSADNEEVYEEGARRMVQSAMEGVNATVFAYGQTVRERSPYPQQVLSTLPPSLPHSRILPLSTAAGPLPLFLSFSIFLSSSNSLCKQAR